MSHTRATYQIKANAQSEVITLHDNIIGYSEAAELFKAYIDSAKDNGRIVSYDFDVAKGNQKPISMRAIITAAELHGASYTVDLILLKERV